MGDRRSTSPHNWKDKAIALRVVTVVICHLEHQEEMTVVNRIIANRDIFFFALLPSDIACNYFLVYYLH